MKLLIINYFYIFRGLEPFEKMEKRMSKDKLYLLCGYDPLLAWVRKSDYAFYQALVEVLIPDVLRPIPSKYFFLLPFLFEKIFLNRIKISATIL